ncbi:MAG: hypothetical protein K2K96_03425 [Lachnospiraceae bacterium]|nr:hypothetical protein [Lachnospiraceae bacterium]
MTVQEELQQKALEQQISELYAEQKPTEAAVKRGPGLKAPVADQEPEAKQDSPVADQEPEAKQDSPVPQINPALKYGRRMDYKTAKVNDKQTKDLNLSLSSLPSSSNHQDEPKSALELELEALEAKAASTSSMIPNPLPTPKKRVPKEMEFDIEPPEYAMHFDLVDLNGKDYFDIN